MFGNPKIYTTTGFGPRKNREMAGVDHLVVYMQTVVKYNTFYMHHPGGVQCPRGGVYTNCSIVQYIHEEVVYTSHFLIFSKPKPGGGVYIWCPQCMLHPVTPTPEAVNDQFYVITNWFYHETSDRITDSFCVFRVAMHRRS